VATAGEKHATSQQYLPPHRGHTAKKNPRTRCLTLHPRRLSLPFRRSPRACRRVAGHTTLVYLDSTAPALQQARNDTTAPESRKQARSRSTTLVSEQRRHVTVQYRMEFSGHALAGQPPQSAHTRLQPWGTPCCAVVHSDCRAALTRQRGGGCSLRQFSDQRALYQTPTHTHSHGTQRSSKRLLGYSLHNHSR
jgi:hypothetical protein